MTPDEYREHVKAVATSLLPLTPEQHDQLWVLLAPMREALAGRAKNRKKAA